ncbi:hypothetical protein CH063_00830 [Colletotrichum higginsianum]|uniref:SUZ RNA-binding domain-containing n=1 Tax=Colletotrichum higginsianum (strain IMI 349063) TaxID=759273 RepID=H1UX87_COLHI|nr:hypothetical protein CH63R_00601 [Colletotrichum higginsianum IMI 349063]OBR15421.1 hypothetical protein CH63R_00601 [Colletotrichum higginsianum IMI 349063]CCF32588.1 hypothetical protein CH063_00830 [Colletotrichum higginsianum]
MVKNAPVPDAWEDDDWESAADKLDGGAPLQPEPEPQAPMSKAERLAQHAESNRKLWESADSPTPLTFLEAQPSVPLATGFKPQVKVLSRKPAPRTIARRDPVTGLLSHLSLADDDADDQRADAKPQLTPEEIRAKQQRELEEKQRRYEEARAKIFGESNPSSGASSPGTTTPPRGGENERGGGGRGRGRGRGRGGGHRGNHSSRQEDYRRPGSSRSDAVRSESGRELYDPGYAPRGGGFGLQKRGGDSGPHSGRSTPRDEDPPKQAMRAPRGPDGSGRGFGFAKRGTNEG